jgi:hypothetical protein
VWRWVLAASAEPLTATRSPRRIGRRADAQAGAQGERDDDLVADVAGGRTKDEALLVGCERGGGEVRHGGLLAAPVPSAGEEVNRPGFPGDRFS